MHPRNRPRGRCLTVQTDAYIDTFCPFLGDIVSLVRWMKPRKFKSFGKVSSFWKKRQPLTLSVWIRFRMVHGITIRIDIAAALRSRLRFGSCHRHRWGQQFWTASMAQVRPRMGLASAQTPPTMPHSIAAPNSSVQLLVSRCRIRRRRD